MCSFEYLHHVRNITFTNSCALINATSFNALAAFFDALEVDFECLAEESIFFTKTATASIHLRIGF